MTDLLTPLVPTVDHAPLPAEKGRYALLPDLNYVTSEEDP